MVLNTQSYMWMGRMGWDGYLLGPTFRAPYGANKTLKLLKQVPPCDCFHSGTMMSP